MAVRTSILAAYQRLTDTLLPEGGASHTLVTKVMLGVWGVIPAFDRYPQSAFRDLGQTLKERSAFNFLRERSLGTLADFYAEHADESDTLSSQHCAADFAAGQPTGRPVPHT